VVARFGLFLQQLQIAQHSPGVQTYGLSLWFGTALIAAGVAVNLLSGWHHVRLVQELEAGRGVRPSTTSLAVATALFLALVGLGMAIYLISIRSSARSNSGRIEENAMPINSNNGIVRVRSNHSVDETLRKLKSTLQTKGVTVFAVIDHSGEAEKVGMKMPPTKVILFGSPRAGTPLMLAAPSAAIDLPLKILIAEDQDGKVWVSYNSPAYLQERHGFPQALVQNIAAEVPLAANAAE
jgi:uncharacterized protein (DUF302 family)